MRTKIFVGLSLTLGIGLFVALFFRLDLSSIFYYVQKVGWGFLGAYLVYALGTMFNTYAWQRIVDPALSKASYLDFWAAFWVGYSVNQLTPTANLGEVYRMAIIKRKVETSEVVVSLILLSFINTLVVQVFTFSSALIFLFIPGLPTQVIWPIFGVATAFFIPVIGFYLVIRLGLAEKVIWLIQKLPFVKFKDPNALTEKARSVDQRVRQFTKERPKDFLIAAASLSVVRLMQFLEVGVLLTPLISNQPWERILLLSVITQTLGQLLAWAATFIPSQIGIAEGGVYILFKWLGFNPVLGFSLAILRRARWVLAVGTGLIVGIWLGVRPSSQQDANNEANVKEE